MSPEALLLFYSVLIILASVTGGRLSSLVQMTHLRTQLLMSGVGGLMLGIALLHLLPHAGEVLQSSSQTGIATLVGLVAMFLLLRLFHTHGHSHGHTHSHADHHSHGHELVPSTDQDGRNAVLASPTSSPNPVAAGQHHQHHANPDYHGSDEHTCGEGPHAEPEHAPAFHRESDAAEALLPTLPDLSVGKKGVGWAGIFFGFALHTLIDGVALGSSVIAESQHGAWLGMAGLGTFLAVVLHKPLDAFAITSVMSRQGWSVGAQNLANGLFSLACPVGAALLYFGVTRLTTGGDLLGWGLAISAGFFICIALSDLLPEVAFHDHDRLKLTLALFLGIAIAVGIESLPGHQHGPHEHGLEPVQGDQDWLP